MSISVNMFSVFRKFAISRRRFGTAAVLFVLWFGSFSSAGAAEVEPLYQLDLVVPRPRKKLSPAPRTKALWIEALGQPEVDLKREAAETIAVAHQRGFPDLADTAPLLMSTLDAPGAHAFVKVAAAHALVALDARESAELLMRHALEDGLDFALVAEPALAAWGHAPMNAVWLERIQGSPSSPRSLGLAIRAAATVRLTEAAPRLREFVMNRTLGRNLRLESARSLAQLSHEGLEEDAGKLAGTGSSGPLIDRLLAVTLLSLHKGAAAEALLVQLGIDPEPTIASISLRRILEIDPGAVQPHNAKLLASADPNVRMLSVKIVTTQRIAESPPLVAGLLGDPHPDVSQITRDSLVELASIDALTTTVQEAVLQSLGSTNPKVAKDAAIVAARTRQKSAVPKLLELLDSKSSEVAIAAAWAFREMRDPETAAPLMQIAVVEGQKVQAAMKQLQQKDAVATANGAAEAVDVETRLAQFTYLIEAFGLMKAHAAEPLLLSLAQSNPLFQNQAVWALATMYENDPQSNIVDILGGFVKSGPPYRRAMAAAGLARIQAKDMVDLLRGYYKPGDALKLQRRVDELEPDDVFKYACAAAVAKLTGEPIAPLLIPAKGPGVKSDWFLQSLDGNR